MGIWAHRYIFPQLAAMLIALFVTVLCMHVFITHEHQHESFGAGLVLPVHNATGEKFFVIALPASLFIAFSTIFFIRNLFSEMRLRARREPDGGRAPDLFQCLFAHGILHSKAY